MRSRRPVVGAARYVAKRSLERTGVPFTAPHAATRPHGGNADAPALCADTKRAGTVAGAFPSDEWTLASVPNTARPRLIRRHCDHNAARTVSPAPIVERRSRCSANGSAPMTAASPIAAPRNTGSRATSCRHSWTSTRSARSAAPPTGVARAPRSITAMRRARSGESCASDATPCSAIRRTTQRGSELQPPTWNHDDLRRAL